MRVGRKWLCNNCRTLWFESFKSLISAAQTRDSANSHSFSVSHCVVCRKPWWRLRVIRKAPWCVLSVNRILNGTFHGFSKFHLKPQSWEQKVISIPRFLNGILALDISMQKLWKDSKTGIAVITFHHTPAADAGERGLKRLGGSEQCSGISLSLIRGPLKELGLQWCPGIWNRARRENL